MLNRIIIADTSVLISLSNIDELSLLAKIYKNIVITPEVSAEFGEKLPEWITVEEVTDKKKIRLLELELDLGEASAIALAIEEENSLLIIDERKGREIAKRMGLKITGILGVILKAKKEGVLDFIKPIIENLEAAGFWISPKLKTMVLEKADE